MRKIEAPFLDPRSGLDQGSGFVRRSERPPIASLEQTVKNLDADWDIFSKKQKLHRVPAQAFNRLSVAKKLKLVYSGAKVLPGLLKKGNIFSPRSFFETGLKYWFENPHFIDDSIAIEIAKNRKEIFRNETKRFLQEDKSNPVVKLLGCGNTGLAFSFMHEAKPYVLKMPLDAMAKKSILYEASSWPSIAAKLAQHGMVAKQIISNEKGDPINLDSGALVTDYIKGDHLSDMDEESIDMALYLKFINNREILGSILGFYVEAAKENLDILDFGQSGNISYDQGKDAAAIIECSSLGEVRFDRYKEDLRVYPLAFVVHMFLARLFFMARKQRPIEAIRSKIEDYDDVPDPVEILKQTFSDGIKNKLFSKERLVFELGHLEKMQKDQELLSADCFEKLNPQALKAIDELRYYFLRSPSHS